MSEANKASAARFFEEVWNNGDLDVVDELVADSYVSHDPVNPGVSGPDGVRQLVTKYLSAFPDTHFTIHHLVADGDMLAIHWSAAGTHRGELEGIPPTGKPVTVTGVTLSRMSDGKFAEDWPAWDALGMMQQLGVIPAQASQ